MRMKSHLKTTVLFFALLPGSLKIIAQQIDVKYAEALTKKNAVAIGLSQADLFNSRVSDAYVDKISGAAMVYLQQTYKGVDVFNSIQTLAFKNDKLIASAGKRFTHIEGMVNTKEGKASFSPGDAVRAAAMYLKLTP